MASRIRPVRLRPADSRVILEDVDGAAGRTWSFSTFQAAVGLVAGLSSIVAAAYSAVDTLRAAPAPGEIVAILRDASAEPVSAAVVEVLGPENTLITTMMPGDDGIARRAVVAGPYRVRVVHAGFVETERDVKVLPDAATELHIVLARKPRPATTAGAEPSARTRNRGSVVDEAAHAVNRGVGAGRRLLSRIGF